MTCSGQTAEVDVCRLQWKEKESKTSFTSLFIFWLPHKTIGVCMVDNVVFRGYQVLQDIVKHPSEFDLYGHGLVWKLVNKVKIFYLSPSQEKKAWKFMLNTPNGQHAGDIPCDTLRQGCMLSCNTFTSVWPLFVINPCSVITGNRVQYAVQHCFTLGLIQWFTFFQFQSTHGYSF